MKVLLRTADGLECDMTIYDKKDNETPPLKIIRGIYTMPFFCDGVRTPSEAVNYPHRMYEFQGYCRFNMPMYVEVLKQ